MHKKVVLIFVIVVVIFIAGIIIFQLVGKSENTTIDISQPSPKACTEEAKICPDGSAVGRSGPNCEFAPCPENNSQMANPASVYCEKNGGKLDMRTGNDGGQIGYCKFSDGTECEEWQYFRKECAPGK